MEQFDGRHDYYHDTSQAERDAVESRQQFCNNLDALQDYLCGTFYNSTDDLFATVSPYLQGINTYATESQALDIPVSAVGQTNAIRRPFIQYIPELDHVSATMTRDSHSDYSSIHGTLERIGLRARRPTANELATYPGMLERHYIPQLCYMVRPDQNYSLPHISLVAYHQCDAGTNLQAGLPKVHLEFETVEKTDVTHTANQLTPPHLTHLTDSLQLTIDASKNATSIQSADRITHELLSAKNSQQLHDTILDIFNRHLLGEKIYNITSRGVLQPDSSRLDAANQLHHTPLVDNPLAEIVLSRVRPLEAVFLPNATTLEPQVYLTFVDIRSQLSFVPCGGITSFTVHKN